MYVQKEEKSKMIPEILRESAVTTDKRTETELWWPTMCWSERESERDGIRAVARVVVVA